MSTDKISLDAAEFDKLFKEEQASLRGNKKPVEDVVEPAPAETDTASTDTDTASEATGEATAAAEGETATTTAGEGTEAATDDSTQAGNAATQNWLDSLDPVIRANVEQLIRDNQAKEHQIRSNNGRLAAEQRKAREAEQRLAALSNKTPASTTQHQQTPAQKAEEDERLKQLKEVDPTLYEILKEEREERLRLQQELMASKTAFEDSRKSQEEHHFNIEMSRLESLVPNYREIWESDAYRQYMDELAPRAIQRAASTPTAEGAAQAIYAYGKWAEEQNRLAGFTSTTTTASTTQTAVDPAAIAQAQKTQAERNRKVQAQPVASNTTARPSAVPGDALAEVLSDPKKHAQFFEQEFEKERKRIGLK